MTATDSARMMLGAPVRTLAVGDSVTHRGTPGSRGVIVKINRGGTMTDYSVCYDDGQTHRACRSSILLAVVA